MQTTGCFWKAPKLMKLFQSTSETLITQLTTCTGPWVNSLLGFNASTADPGQTPWLVITHKLEYHEQRVRGAAKAQSI